MEPHVGIGCDVVVGSLVGVNDGRAVGVKICIPVGDAVEEALQLTVKVISGTSNKKTRHCVRDFTRSISLHLTGRPII